MRTSLNGDIVRGKIGSSHASGGNVLLTSGTRSVWGLGARPRLGVVCLAIAQDGSHWRLAIRIRHSLGIGTGLLFTNLLASLRRDRRAVTVGVTSLVAIEAGTSRVVGYRASVLVLSVGGSGSRSDSRATIRAMSFQALEYSEQLSWRIGGLDLSLLDWNGNCQSNSAQVRGFILIPIWLEADRARMCRPRA
jgi:hypothetical protein